MFTSGEKAFTIFDMFFIIFILLPLTQIIISVIHINQIKSKLENFKESIIKVEDIPISVVGSIRFDQNKTKPEYIPNAPNLGLAGNLILDCYSGYCTKEVIETRENEVCPKDEDSYNDCDYETYEY